MRVALIGVSHWHTPFYLDPLLTMPDMTVIGLSVSIPGGSKYHARSGIMSDCSTRLGEGDGNGNRR